MSYVLMRGMTVAAAVAVITHGAAGQVPRSLHGALPDSLDCSSCHTSGGWRPARSRMAFDHDRTVFPLHDRHARTACQSCHLNLRFDEPDVAAADCAACHLDIHEGALSPTCTNCHTTTSFREVEALRVHATTSFPLVGAHQQVDCTSCHVDESAGAYAPLPTACIQCHATELANAAIDHESAGFGMDCQSCHTSLTWTGGVAFGHAESGNGFQLLGAHARTQCASCHIIPGYERIYPATSQDDCVGCHATDYDREHAGSGFPTICTDCHTVENWDADFDHDGRFFPIDRGAHRGKWSSCATCHNVVGDLSAFTCVTCHEHQESKMADVHQGRSGYVWDSQSCLSCHPDGRS